MRRRSHEAGWIVFVQVYADGRSSLAVPADTPKSVADFLTEAAKKAVDDEGCTKQMKEGERHVAHQ
jgi:tripartite-type tricarboxylate transporter receptor subunit TctC